MPKQQPKNVRKMVQHGSKFGPSWGHVGFQNRLGRVQERKKTTPKTGQESSSKSIPSGNRDAAAVRCGAESKWPPQGGWGAT